jgi:hypothetical protein
MTANTAQFDVLTGTSALLHHPERHKYGTDIVWNAEIRPIEVVVVPGWLPLRVEIEAVVRWPFTPVGLGGVE